MIFLPPFTPRQVLDPDQPITIGAMVGPEAFMEVRYLQHQNLNRALEVIPELSFRFERQFGRECGGLVRPYLTEDAETIVVALGSVNGRMKDAVDEMRAAGIPIGSLSICCYRPFPFAAVQASLAGACQVFVLEKNIAPGMGGVVTSDIQSALAGTNMKMSTVIAGLGGRPITKASLRRLFNRAERGTLEPVDYLELNPGFVTA